jgi:hypothetical protein
MKHDFKIRRRKLLNDGNLAQYKKIVMLYKKAIESKLEDNLRLIASKVFTNIQPFRRFFNLIIHSYFHYSTYLYTNLVHYNPWYS